MYIQSKKVVIRIKFLYHGTINTHAANIVCKGVLLTESKPHLDFGPGFYTTPDYEFALETAKNHAKKHNYFYQPDLPVTPKVLVFEVDEKLFNTMNCKEFKRADSTWSKFILANRCTNQSVHDSYDNNLSAKYDIVSGPTADGKGTFTPIVEAINSGDLSIEDANYDGFAPAKHKKWGKQISFHTDQSLSCIRLKSVL